MSEEIDSLIKKKEAELAPLRQRMEALRGKFAKETVAFAIEWYRKTAKDYIAKYPEVTLALSEEKIASMKSQVNDLARNAEKIVKAEFSNPALWWHMEPHLGESIERYQQVADKYPEVLDSAVRRVLGHLGVVLEAFGFRVTASGNTGAYYEFWFERPVNSRESVPCYPHLFDWTDEMQDIIREYDAQYVKAMGVYEEIQLLKEEKKRQEALHRWDNI